MSEWVSMKIKRDVYQRLLNLKADLSKKKGRVVDFSEAMAYALEKVGY